MPDRESIAEEPEIILDEKIRAKRESENTLTQLDWAMAEVYKWVNNEKRSLKTSTLLQLNRLALEAVHSRAGNFRSGKIKIKGSGHKPIKASDVPKEIEHMMDYLSDNWERKTPIHLAAYAMWRVNWIHPFADGNGRTARVFSYMVLCAKMKFLPSKGNTIPDQISVNKQPYYKALEHADKHYKNKKIDVSAMEGLLESYFESQLLGMHQQATGRTSYEENAKTDKNQLGTKRESRFSKWYDKIEKRPVLFRTIFGTIFGAIITFGAVILGYFLS